jgi:hypothetical protein
MRSPDRHAGRCAVCDAALACGVAPGARQDDLYPVCHAIACRMVVSRRAALGEAGFGHYLAIQARQTRRQAMLAAASVARTQAEAEENAAAWSALRARLRLTKADGALQLLLPSGPRHERRVASARRERYRAHLLRLAAEAACGPPAEPPPAADPAGPAAASALPGRLCALCGGGCCTRGGEHAYLVAATLRRFMDAHPQLSSAEVAAAYLDRVAPSTQSGSCINHTRQGCSLPREMRSDTCNRFACESLARLQAAQRGEQPVPVVLVVRRKQDQWRRSDPALDNAVNGGAMLSEAGIRRLPAGSLRPPAGGA